MIASNQDRQSTQGQQSRSDNREWSIQTITSNTMTPDDGRWAAVKERPCRAKGECRRAASEGMLCAVLGVQPPLSPATHVKSGGWPKTRQHAPPSPTRYDTFRQTVVNNAKITGNSPCHHRHSQHRIASGLRDRPWCNSLPRLGPQPTLANAPSSSDTACCRLQPTSPQSIIHSASETKKNRHLIIDYFGRSLRLPDGA